MPHVLLPPLTVLEQELLARVGLSRYSSIVDYGHTALIEETDTVYDRYTYELYAPGTVVFSLDLDGGSPWGDANAFYQYNLINVEDWEYSDPDDCDCPDCRPEQEEDTYDPYGQESTDDPGANTSRLHVKRLTNRPTRMTSVEIEVGMGGNYLAEKLHDAGLSDYGYMGGYHDMDDSSFVRVEEDSSVAAEVIFSRMRLDGGDAAKFEQGIGIIRQAINDNRSKLDMRCGLHIHVNLGHDGATPCYGMDDVASLYHLWNYVEDTIFRLGAANWRGHRSEFGNDYAPKTVKGFRRAAEVGQHMTRSRGALNLSNYLGARHNCRCGAFDFGNWRECTCDLGRSTVEFRVFNTSANTRKIRAYVALCQALVAAASAKRYGPDEYPAFEWTESGEVDVSASKERLEFILNELPLTNDERQDILYCAEKSSLSAVLDQEYLRVLWANE